MAKRHYIPITADVPGAATQSRCAFIRKVIRTALAAEAQCPPTLLAALRWIWDVAAGFDTGRWRPSAGGVWLRPGTGRPGLLLPRLRKDIAGCR